MYARPHRLSIQSRLFAAVEDCPSPHKDRGKAEEFGMQQHSARQRELAYWMCLICERATCRQLPAAAVPLVVFLLMKPPPHLMFEQG